MESNALTTARASKVQLNGDGREMANGNPCGQRCHKLNKAAKSSSIVPARRPTEGCVVFKSNRSVYSSVRLRWRLLPLGTGVILGIDQSHVGSLLCNKDSIMKVSKMFTRVETKS